MKSLNLDQHVRDMVHDLRSRNLLLVVLMLVVAIVAVPLLVSSSGSSDDSLSIGPGTQASTVAPEGQSAVVGYQPGIRNFKKRLRDLSAKNPFSQQFPAASTSASTPGSTPASAIASPGEGSTGSTGGSGGGNGGGNKGGGGHKKTTTNTLYTSYITDVNVGEAGGTLTTVNGVQQFQFLPAQDKPVLVYLGTNSGGTQALFLVSKDVSSVGGTGTCFPSADACQLLGLSVGTGADLVYGPDGKTYHLDVTQIRRVTSSKPPA